MKKILVRLVLIFGVIAIIVPFVMVYLWNAYVTQQEATQGTAQTHTLPCEPAKLTLTHTKEQKLEIAWETQSQCADFLLLGATYADFGNLPYKVVPVTTDTVEKHSYVVMLQKQDELQYTYGLIVSNDQWYGIQGQPFILPKAK